MESLIPGSFITDFDFDFDLVEVDMKRFWEVA